MLINSTIEQLKVEEGGEGGKELKNAHLIEVDFNESAGNCTQNNETMLGNNQEETYNTNSQPNSHTSLQHPDEGSLEQNEILIKEEDSR